MSSPSPSHHPHALDERGSRDVHSLLRDSRAGLQCGALDAAIDSVNQVLNGRADVTPEPTAEALRLLRDISAAERARNAASRLQDATAEDLRETVRPGVPRCEGGRTPPSPHPVRQQQPAPDPDSSPAPENEPEQAPDLQSQTPADGKPTTTAGTLPRPGPVAADQEAPNADAVQPFPATASAPAEFRATDPWPQRPVRRRRRRLQYRAPSYAEGIRTVGGMVYDCLLALLDEEQRTLMTARFPVVRDVCLAITEETTSEQARDALARLLGAVDDPALRIELRRRLTTILTVRDIMTDADRKRLIAEDGGDED